MKKIKFNKATREDFLRIPGINRELIEKIQLFRKNNGEISSKKVLLSVPGVTRENAEILAKGFVFEEDRRIVVGEAPEADEAPESSQPVDSEGAKVKFFTASSEVQLDNKTGYSSSEISVVVEYSVAVMNGEVVKSVAAKPGFDFTRYAIAITEAYPILLEKGVVVYAKLPTGALTGRTLFSPQQFEAKQLPLKIENARPEKVQPPMPVDSFTKRHKFVTGRVLDVNNIQVFAKALVMIFTTKDSNPGAESFEMSAYAECDSQGYFTTPYIEGAFTQAYALVGMKGDSKCAIKLKSTTGNNFPEKLVLPIDYKKAEDCDDCACDELDFHRKNQVLEEFSYYSVIRITEPKVKPLVLEDEPDVKLKDLLFDMPWLTGMVVDTYKKLYEKPRHSLQPLALMAREAPATIAAPGSAGSLNPILSLIDNQGGSRVVNMDSGPADGTVVSMINEYSVSKNVLSSFMLKNKTIDHSNISELFQMNERAKIKGIFTKVGSPYGGRSRLGDNHVVDWDDEPTIYQSCEIAHGHLLHFKQVWTADGYSIGDLLYSLPLAPGQKKQIVVYDWDRRDSAVRDDQRTYSDRLDAEISRDRDISEVVSGTFSEEIDAKSTAKTSSFSAGLGAGIIVPSPTPMGAVLGASGGASKASSTAHQEAFRETTSSSHQQLSDRTMQSASSVRGQRSTVIQTISEGEKYQVTSETVANYNHCHSLTMQYFEVLRHFKIYQKLVGVQECLFVPLEMKPFDIYKANRWSDILSRTLPTVQLKRGLPAIKRYIDNWAHANFPDGSYADEEILNIHGEVTLQFKIARPEDSDKDEFVPANWYWATLLTPYYSGRDIFQRYKSAKIALDEFFASECGPAIAAEFVNKLRLVAVSKNGTSVEIPIDCTLVSEFRNRVELKVTIRNAGQPFRIRRSDIFQLRFTTKFRKDSIPSFGTLFPQVFANSDHEISSSYLLPKGSSVTMRSVRIGYATEHFEGWIVSDNRVNNDLTGDDDVWIYTPVSLAEKSNPKNNDLTLINALIDHLNSNIETYHKAIWLKMSPERRFMLLDGIVCTGKEVQGKSVASVVDNKVLGVVGNCLVMPVAPGQYINPVLDYPQDESGKVIDLLDLYRTNDPDPVSVTIPTKGVFAEAVMGSCNSCEKIEEDRYWRWEQSPIPDSPTTISAVNPNEDRYKQPQGMESQDFPTPVINIQNTPNAPDPSGVSGVQNLLGKSDTFRDLTGLAGNQANAMKALEAAYASAGDYASKASELTKLALQARMSKDMDRVMEKIEDAKSKGLITPEQANDLTQSTLRGAIGAGPTRPTSEEAETSQARMSEAQVSAVNAVAQRGGQVSLRNTDGSTVEARVGTTAGAEAEAEESDSDRAEEVRNNAAVAALDSVVNRLTGGQPLTGASFGEAIARAIRGGNE